MELFERSFIRSAFCIWFWCFSPVPDAVTIFRDQIALFPRYICRRTVMVERTPLVEDIQNYAQNIVDTVREPLLILDATLRVRSANRAFYQTFHVSPDETEGRLIYELGNGQWDIPDLRTLLEDIVPKSSVFDDFELEHTFPAIGRRVMLLNARKLQAGHHGELLVLAMEDVTERRRSEADLLEAGALQNAIF